MRRANTNILFQQTNPNVQQRIIQQNSRNWFDNMEHRSREPQRNALADLEVRGAQQAVGQNEQALIAQSLDGIASLPEGQRAQAYQMEAQRLQGMGVQIPPGMETYDPETFAVARAVNRMAPEELTAFQRNIQGLSAEEQYAAMRVQAGLVPKAQAPKQESAPTSVREYEVARSQGYQGSFLDWKNDQRGNGITIGKDGTVQIGGNGKGVTKLTENQSKFTLFGSMMEKTMPTINDLEEQFDPSNLGDNVAAQLGWAGNWAKSEEFQKYETAGRAWAEGVLRLQTGAAATQPEIERVFSTYFAQPGDGPETVQLKRELRSEYADSIRRASGNLVDPNSALSQETDLSTMSDDELQRLLQSLPE